MLDWTSTKGRVAESLSSQDLYNGVPYFKFGNVKSMWKPRLAIDWKTSL